VKFYVLNVFLKSTPTSRRTCLKEHLKPKFSTHSPLLPH